MTNYVRILGRDTWHFNERCQHMKRIVKRLTDANLRGTKPRSGEFCDECLAKAKADKRAARGK